MYQDRAVRRIMLVDTQGGVDIEAPKNVGIGPAHRHRPGRIGRHLPPFIAIRSLVAASYALEVQAHHLVAIAHDVHAVALDGGGRDDADLARIHAAPANFGTTSCQQNRPSFSSRQSKTPRSPWWRGSRGSSLLVPMRTFPPAITGVE